MDAITAEQYLERINKEVQQLGEWSPGHMPFVLPMDVPAPHAQQQSACRMASEVLLANAARLVHKHAQEKVAQVDQLIKQRGVQHAQEQKDLLSPKHAAEQECDRCATYVAHYDAES